MTKLVRTAQGIGRVVGERVEIISTTHTDLAAVFADESFDIAAAAPTSSHALAELDLRRPIDNPAKVVIVGLNYHAHAAEIGADAPTAPAFIVCEGGPGIVTEWDHAIVLPSDAPTMVDYEAELGLIMGSAASNVAEDAAWDQIGGVVAVNDVSARDVQQAALAEGARSLGLSKTYPTFKPVSSIVITPDELDIDHLDIDHLDMEVATFVNGEQRQRGRLDDMIFGVPELIAAISERVELEPGDLICTGTPAGVGLASGTFLEPGDRVRVTVEGIGTVENEVVSP